MAVFSNHSNKKEIDDEFYTLKDDWKKIEKYIPKDKIAWEAFSNGDFESVEYLKTICKEVKYNTGDFFENDNTNILFDIILTNPPFSIKKQVLERLKLLDKPFILILPTLSLQTKYMKSIFGDDLQIILPTKKIFFYKIINGKKKIYNKLSYYCCYVCYKINLEKDIIFID
tara:strand:+ start:17 stop:529 length:513 start_codon:yes stop_codon:yes gene_type:complete